MITRRCPISRRAVLSLVRAGQVPIEHVEWFDTSRQTTRIALNDNLMNKTSPPEIKAAVGR